MPSLAGSAAFLVSDLVVAAPPQLPSSAAPFFRTSDQIRGAQLGSQLAPVEVSRVARQTVGQVAHRFEATLSAIMRRAGAPAGWPWLLCAPILFLALLGASSKPADELEGQAQAWAAELARGLEGEASQGRATESDIGAESEAEEEEEIEFGVEQPGGVGRQLEELQKWQKLAKQDSSERNEQNATRPKWWPNSLADEQQEARSAGRQRAKRSLRSRAKIGSAGGRKIMRKLTPTRVLVGAHAASWAYRQYSNYSAGANQTSNSTSTSTSNSTSASAGQLANSTALAQVPLEPQLGPTTTPTGLVELEGGAVGGEGGATLRPDESGADEQPAERRRRRARPEHLAELLRIAPPK